MVGVFEIDVVLVKDSIAGGVVELVEVRVAFRDFLFNRVLMKPFGVPAVLVVELDVEALEVARLLEADSFRSTLFNV